MLMHSVIDNFILSWSQNSVKLHLTSKELCSEQKNIFQVNPIVIFLSSGKTFRLWQTLCRHKTHKT